MARLIRMDHTGHTTLAEWTAGDADAVEAAVAAFREQLDAGYYAVVSTGEGQAEQVRELPRGRRARDPAPADRRRVARRWRSSRRPSGSTGARGSTRAGCGARPRVDADDGRPHRAVPGHRRRCWSRSSRWRRRSRRVGRPRVGDPRPLRAPRRERGQAQAARRRRRPSARRSGCSATSSATRRASCTRAPAGDRARRARRLARGGGGRAARRAGRPARDCCCVSVPGPDLPVGRPHRAPAARAARGRGRLRHRGQPRVQRRPLAGAPAPAEAACAPGARRGGPAGGGLTGRGQGRRPARPPRVEFVRGHPYRAVQARRFELCPPVHGHRTRPRARFCHALRRRPRTTPAAPPVRRLVLVPSACPRSAEGVRRFRLARLRLEDGRETPSASPT